MSLTKEFVFDLSLSLAVSEKVCFGLFPCASPQSLKVFIGLGRVSLANGGTRFTCLFTRRRYGTMQYTTQAMSNHMSVIARERGGGGIALLAAAAGRCAWRRLFWCHFAAEVFFFFFFFFFFYFLLYWLADLLDRGMVGEGVRGKVDWNVRACWQKYTSGCRHGEPRCVLGRFIGSFSPSKVNLQHSSEVWWKHRCID